MFKTSVKVNINCNIVHDDRMKRHILLATSSTRLVLFVYVNCLLFQVISSLMSNETTTVDWLPDDLLPSNGSQVRDNTNSDDNISIVSVAKATADKSRRLGDTVLLSIVCVGLVGNAVALSALSSRGCRGRRRRWRTHHALAILLQVTDPLELTI